MKKILCAIIIGSISLFNVVGCKEIEEAKENVESLQEIQGISTDDVKEDIKSAIINEKKEPELLCTRPCCEEIATGELYVNGGLNTLGRNFDSYKGKRVFLDGVEIAEIGEHDGKPVYVCYDPYSENTDVVVSIKFDDSQLKQKYFVGDYISTVGTLIDNMDILNGVYNIGITTNCVLDYDDIGYMQRAYEDLKNMGDYNYELRPYDRLDDRSAALFKAINVNTGEVKYIRNDGYETVWCDENWTPLDGRNMKAEGGELE